MGCSARSISRAWRRVRAALRCVNPRRCRRDWSETASNTIRDQQMADKQMVWKEPITASVRILYWLDIPSKVEVEDEAGVVTRSLSDRYQNLIHKLETRAGDGTAVGQWREYGAATR